MCVPKSVCPSQNTIQTENLKGISHAAGTNNPEKLVAEGFSLKYLTRSCQGLTREERENCTVLSRHGEGRGCWGIIEDWAAISRLTASVVRHSLSFAGLLLPSGTNPVPFGSKPLGDQDSVGLWPPTYHNK